MEAFTEKEKLQVTYDDMIQDYLYSGVYPNATGSTKFALFNVLYGSEFEPLQVNQFQFSTAFTKYLPLIHSSEQRRRLALNTTFIESQLDRMQLDVPTMECNLIHEISFDNYDEFETMFRECLVLLESSHFLYMTTIVFAIIQLFKYAQLHYDVQPLVELCQATWFGRYHQLLYEYAFESETDRIHQRLCRLAVCYMQFKRVLSFPHTPFPVAIWDQHYLERSIYLSSINQFNKTNQDVLRLVEKIVFTTTA
ncbi:uncharacterized protein B0P05DRAFT_15811 [Gilbertella persicaria]|uniref:uncharacterized protein n=1 Tax=Gilbertella persicaria TaxID=101096 RepID=UPI0022211F21|nr:uncharacterized protein B0P05DRAFT_15811 [Gilbertella persicaria]KAI8086922.1 hypothetical protein B0P05DRAFT_15811 [Gilbertella persicaria]